MEYRVVVIYETKSNRITRTRIEVCLNSGAKKLSPFQRRVNLDELWNCSTIQNKDILKLLDQTGQQSQPFVLEGEILTQPRIREILKSNDYVFTQNGGKGTVKRLTKKPFLPTPIGMPIQQGHVLCGELYINNMHEWNKGIQVRLLYTDSLTSFRIPYNEIPFITHNNEFRLRNSEQEDRYLKQIKDFVDTTTSTMSLSDSDISFLTELTKENWRLYVSYPYGGKHKLYSQHDKLGIDWFSTTEEIDEIPSQKLLEAYLKRRNYIESDGNIIILNHKKIKEQSTNNIVESLDCHDITDVTRIYKERKTLTESQKQQIKSEIAQQCSAKLHQYQMEGVNWLAENRMSKTGCLLADEMGLGKTLQVLAYLSTIKDCQYPHLIIAPTSLIPNWQNEITKFFPQWVSKIELQPHAPHSTSGYVISSYDIIRLNIEQYRKVHFDTIVIDEAQTIKNDNTQKYQAIASLQSNHVIIMTGTPIENSVREIWSLFYILNPSFRLIADSMKKYATSQDDANYIELSSKVLAPFILRRTKEEVHLQLPKKDIIDIFVEMAAQERKIYKRVQHTFITALRTGVSGRLNSIALEGLLRMRQACVDSSLLPAPLNTSKSFQSTKLSCVMSYILRFKAEGHKTIVFSQFVGVLNRIEGLCDERKIKYEMLYGNTTDRKTPVEKFQNEAETTVFLISLKVGGVGLNLTAADRLILMDDWWNPAVEDQAFARAHRIGQKNDVEIYRIICRDTVEEKLLKLQEKKRQTVDLFNSASSKLTYEELKDLIF